MRWCLPILLASLLTAQQPTPDFPKDFPKKDEPTRLPNGKLQSEEILKEEHKKSLKDVADLKKLIDEFYTDFEKSDRHVVSVPMLKKLDEIEKRAKRIKGRLTRG